LDEAVRIRREECLPVFLKLGDVRSVLVCRTNIAMVLLIRKVPADIPEAIDHLRWSLAAADERGYAEAAQIRGIMKQIGFIIDLPEHGAADS